MAKTKERDPNDLKFAFHRAVMSFALWYKFGGPEPEVFFEPVSREAPPSKESSVSINAICDLVERVADKMTEQDCDLLYILARRAPRGKRPLENDTYANGAKCLRGLIRHQKERHELENRLYGV